MRSIAGIWDSDEFMIIRDGSLDLPTVLRRYEAYGGLGVNWRLFGSSGHKTWWDGMVGCWSVGREGKGEGERLC